LNQSRCSAYKKDFPPSLKTVCAFMKFALADQRENRGQILAVAFVDAGAVFVLRILNAPLQLICILGSSYSSLHDPTSDSYSSRQSICSQAQSDSKRRCQ
jgi:hypothetical protein